MNFRLFKTDVKVQPFFFLLAAFLGYMGLAGQSDWVERLLIFAVIVFVGVLAHEFGHAFAGRQFGLTPAIELHGMGGVTRWKTGKPLSPGRSIWVSFAGPLVGIIIGSVALAVQMNLAPAADSLLDYTLSSLVFVNLGWGVLNLIPMAPLDGGHILLSFSELVFGARGRIWARMSSVALAGLILVYMLYGALSGQGFGSLFMLYIVGSLAWSNFQALKRERAIGPDLGLIADLRKAHQELSGGQPDRALALAQSVSRRAQSNAVKSDAQHLLAWIHLAKNDAESAAGALERSKRPADPALVGVILFEQGDVAGSIEPLMKGLKGATPLVENRLVTAFVDTGQFERAAALFATPNAKDITQASILAVEEAAYRANDFGAAAKLGEVAFDRFADPLRAFNVACSLTRAGELDEAMSWLRTARDAGFEQTKLLDEDEDLAPLRGREDWTELRSGIVTQS